MKKYFSVFFATVIALAVFASCQKNDGDDTPAGNDDPIVKEQVTITASMPVEGLVTKIALSQDESDKKVVKLEWENDDVIDINGETFTIDNASISVNKKSANFTGDKPTADGSGKYTISYTNLPGSFGEQTQDSDGDTEHLGYFVELSGASSLSSRNQAQPHLAQLCLNPQC